MHPGVFSESYGLLNESETRFQVVPGWLSDGLKLEEEFTLTI